MSVVTCSHSIISVSIQLNSQCKPSSYRTLSYRFSSPDNHSGIQFNLNEKNSIGEVDAEIHGMNINKIIGLSDLSLLVISQSDGIIHSFSHWFEVHTISVSTVYYNSELR